MQRYAMSALFLLIGGWMSFDGIRALALGDYVTAETGSYAGQLGPWAWLVQSAGVDPRSVGMKGVHVLCGVLGIATSVALLFGAGLAPRLVVCSSLAVFWYLPFGTIVGLLGLLYYFRSRAVPRTH